SPKPTTSASTMPSTATVSSLTPAPPPSSGSERNGSGSDAAASGEVLSLSDGRWKERGRALWSGEGSGAVEWGASVRRRRGRTGALPRRGGGEGPAASRERERRTTRKAGTRVGSWGRMIISAPRRRLHPSTSGERHVLAWPPRPGGAEAAGGARSSRVAPGTPARPHPAPAPAGTAGTQRAPPAQRRRTGPR